jgi:predicted transcriptional regulator
MAQAKDIIESHKNFQLITVNSTDSILEVIDVLAKNKISSAPVVGTNNTIIGNVDILDISTFSFQENFNNIQCCLL